MKEPKYGVSSGALSEQSQLDINSGHHKLSLESVIVKPVRKGKQSDVTSLKQLDVIHENHEDRGRNYDGGRDTTPVSRGQQQVKPRPTRGGNSQNYDLTPVHLR